MLAGARDTAPLVVTTWWYCRTGETLIRQGDDGNCLYVIELGEVNVYKISPGETEAKLVSVMTPGDTVGELALLYNVPRAATVIAKNDVVLW